MKLTTLILFAFCIHVAARSSAQNVSLSVKNKPLEKVFSEIRKQTGFSFIYGKDLIKKAFPVSVTVKEQPLEQVLDILFRDQPLTYKISEGYVVVSPREIPVIISIPPPPPALTVHGRVTNETGEPVQGVSVTVKGTTKGTVTDGNGEFTIPNVEDQSILIFTAINIETAEIKLNGRSEIALATKTKVSKIDEVQVIAYGTTTRRNSTANISVVQGEDIAKSPVSNALMAIQGRVPGININQKTGFAGAAVSTLVQGQNSILKGNDPFYVIDGVPYPSQGLSITGDMLGTAGVNTIAKGSTLNFINPADIESITVLKDADATAIYGSRAANGAILITTKKGKQGKTKFTFDYQQGAGKVTRKLDLMNTSQYLQMRHEAIRLDGGVVSAFDYDINGFWDTTRNTDFQKEYIGHTAHYRNISGTISGGNSNAQYLVGATFHRETGVQPGDFADQKGSVHFNVNSNSDNNKFKMTFSGSYMVDDNRLPYTDLTAYAVVTPPDAPPSYLPDGSLNFSLNSFGSPTFFNPLAEMRRKFNIKTKNLVSNLLLSYEIARNLNLRTSLGYTDMQSTELVTFPLTSNSPDQIPFANRTGFYGNYDIATWIAEPQVSYNVLAGPGKLDVLMGGSIQRNNGNGNKIMGSGFITDEAIDNINNATTLTPNGVTAYEYKYAGAFGRVNYVMQDKYIVNLSARRDGTSRFGLANRFHNFAAAGLGWVFSSENFVKDQLSWLSYGKLRASYGTTGNDQIGNYQYLNLYNPVVVGVPYRGIPSLRSQGVNNPYLQWEETKKINLGLDLGILKDRILVNANYYINLSSNQLMFYALPVITGVSSIIINYPATVQNSGLELTLNANVFRGNKFRWTASANATVPRNKLVEFKNLETSSYGSLLVVGQPITIVKVYHYAGVDPATGIYQFYDSHGSLTTNPNYTSDRQYIINMEPKWYGGFSNDFSYGNLSLSFLFQFMVRNGLNYSTGAYFPGALRANQPTYLMDRWTKPGDVASYQRYNANYSLLVGVLNAGYSDLTFSDASYARLKNISASWQLPARWLKAAHLSNAKVYAEGQNLLTITGYKGLDPETLSSTTLPPLKTLVFGLQFTF